MPKFFVAIICLLSGSFLLAQTSFTLEVRDVHTDLPVSGVKARLLTTEDTLWASTGSKGQAVLPLSGSLQSLKLDHLAYLPETIELKPSQKFVRAYLTPYRQELQEVVVTGQARPVLAEEAVRQVRVINQERIDQQAAVNLRDLLTNDLNFSLTEDGILGSQLSLQGLSGNGIKILIDGVPVIGRLDGNIDISQINLNDIERIEVVEGPMSIQFGTDAVAGTINLITKKDATARPAVGINAYYESVGRYNLDASLQAPVGKAQGSISLGRYYFDGFAEDETSRDLQWNPKEQYFASWSWRRRFNKLMVSYRGDFFDEAITNLGAAGSIDSAISVVDTGAWKYPRALDDFYDTRRFNNSLNADYYINNKMKLKAFAAYNHFRREKRSIIRNLNTGEELLLPGNEAQDTTVFGLLSSRLFFSHSWLNKLSYQVGYDLSHETNQGQRIENGFQDITDVAVFATADYKPVETLTIQPGLRYAYNSRFEAPLIKSLALRWETFPNWVVRASYGEGFRAPSLKELYFFFVDENHNILGNEDLQAETSRNYQLGINYLRRYENGSVESDLGGFFNDIRNQIRLIPVIEPDDEEPRGLFTNRNIDRTMTAGFNYRLRYIHGPWEVEGGFSYIGIRNDLSFSDQAVQAGTDDFLFYPQLRANLYYTFENIGLQPGIFFNHTGRRTDLITNIDGELIQNTFGSFSMADILVKKDLFGFVSLSGGVKNIFNITNLQSSTQVSGGTHGGSSGALPIAYGRTYILRLQLDI